MPRRVEWALIMLVLSIAFLALGATRPTLVMRSESGRLAGTVLAPENSRWVSIHGCSGELSESMGVQCDGLFERESTEEVEGRDLRVDFEWRSLRPGWFVVTVMTFDADRKVTGRTVRTTRIKQ